MLLRCYQAPQRGDLKRVLNRAPILQRQYAAALGANYDNRCVAVGEHLDCLATEYNR
jgi:hypothetical protein